MFQIELRPSKFFDVASTVILPIIGYSTMNWDDRSKTEIWILQHDIFNEVLISPALSGYTYKVEGAILQKIRSKDQSLLLRISEGGGRPWQHEINTGTIARVDRYP